MKYILFIFIIGLFCSCIGKSSNNCKWEKNNYTERWDFTVDKVYKHPQYKSTFVIKTTTNKRILFRPIQDIVAFSEKGDRVIKEENSKYAYRINSNNDTMRSKIFSISCDSIVEN